MQTLDSKIKLTEILQATLALTFKLDTSNNCVELANTQPFSKILMLNATLTLAELDAELANLKEYIEAIGNDMLKGNDQYVKFIQIEPKMEYSFRMVLMSGAIEWLRASGFVVDEEVTDTEEEQQVPQHQVIGVADILFPIHAALLTLNVPVNEFISKLTEINPDIAEIYTNVITEL